MFSADYYGSTYVSLFDESMSRSLPSEARLECDGAFGNTESRAYKCNGGLLQVGIVTLGKWVVNTCSERLRYGLSIALRRVKKPRETNFVC